ncbi:MAG TPA: CbiX/SirB N-terminal domain-containing protein [Verrucomicrobiae bacterium]|nr:CbiX/SirB N-terminal domain-containing protein [Verrucomicrobiae bacterium]
MSQPEFPDAALVLVGHGTTLNEDSATPVYQHAAELRRRNCFAEVREGFWKQQPLVSELFPALDTPRVFIAPLFISEGYFCEQVIPRALGFEREGHGGIRRVQRRSAQILKYCRPVGTHPSMTSALLARARGVVQQYPFPRAPLPNETTLIVAGHGTEQNENSRVVVERQAEVISSQRSYAAVHAVFLEEQPLIPTCYSLAQTKNMVVVPFFISDGLHVREDIPILLGESERIVKQRLQQGQATWRNPTEKQGKLVWYAGSVGTEPSLADVILERVREADSWGSFSG